MNSVTLIPAYGRDYKSFKELMKDWEDGKDFQAVGLFSRGYCSIKDFPKGTMIVFRYKKQMQAKTITV